MASWVKCEAYTEDRTKIWVNLDNVAIIKPFDNGSVLVFATGDGTGTMEHVVWDSAEKLIGGKRFA